MGTRHEPLADFVPASRASQMLASFYEDSPRPQPEICDACDKPIEGEPAGRGLFLWTRGGEVRYEEPPLCAECAGTIAVVAMSAWELEEEGD